MKEFRSVATYTFLTVSNSLIVISQFAYVELTTFNLPVHDISLLTYVPTISTVKSLLRSARAGVIFSCGIGSGRSESTD